jgi:hypothetical protein
VTAYLENERWYAIKYEDGDSEELEASEVIELLHPQPSKKRVKDLLSHPLHAEQPGGQKRRRPSKEEEDEDEEDEVEVVADCGEAESGACPRPPATGRGRNL